MISGEVCTIVRHPSSEVCNPSVKLASLYLGVRCVLDCLGNCSRVITCELLKWLEETAIEGIRIRLLELDDCVCELS